MKVGRKMDKEANKAFVKVTKYMQKNINTQKTITDLVEMMDDILKDSQSTSYSYKYMKARLKEHFKDRIVFTDINCKQILLL